MKQKINITSNKNMKYEISDTDILKETNFQGEQRLIWIRHIGKSSWIFEEKNGSVTNFWKLPWILHRDKHSFCLSDDSLPLYQTKTQKKETKNNPYFFK